MGSNKIKGKCNHTHNGWELQRPPRLFFGKIRVTLHPTRTRTRTILRIFRPHSISLVWLLARFPDFIFDNLLYIFKASVALGGKGSDCWLNTHILFRPLILATLNTFVVFLCFLIPYKSWNDTHKEVFINSLISHDISITARHHLHQPICPIRLRMAGFGFDQLTLEFGFFWIPFIIMLFFYSLLCLETMDVSSLTSYFDCELVRFISFLLIFTDV